MQLKLQHREEELSKQVAMWMYKTLISYVFLQVITAREVKSGIGSI